MAQPKVLKPEEYCMYFPILELHGWGQKIRHSAADDLFRGSLVKRNYLSVASGVSRATGQEMNCSMKRSAKVSRASTSVGSAQAERNCHRAW